MAEKSLPMREGFFLFSLRSYIFRRRFGGAEGVGDENVGEKHRIEKKHKNVKQAFQQKDGERKEHQGVQL